MLRIYYSLMSDLYIVENAPSLAGYERGANYKMIFFPSRLAKISRAILTSQYSIVESELFLGYAV